MGLAQCEAFGLSCLRGSERSGRERARAHPFLSCLRGSEHVMHSDYENA